MARDYKVVEINEVTGQAIEKVLNEWTRQGFTLDNIQMPCAKH